MMTSDAPGSKGHTCMWDYAELSRKKLYTSPIDPSTDNTLLKHMLAKVKEQGRHESERRSNLDSEVTFVVYNSLCVHTCTCSCSASAVGFTHFVAAKHTGHIGCASKRFDRCMVPIVNYDHYHTFLAMLWYSHHHQSNLKWIKGIDTAELHLILVHQHL